jgi:hypothetical protein
MALLPLLHSIFFDARAYPPDPFAEEYVVPKERDVGTTAGQLRAIAAGAIGLGPHGAFDVGAQGTLEAMTIPYVGLRGTLEGAPIHASGDPSVFMAKGGPSFHLFPYRRVDLSLFFEAGVATIAGAIAPVVSPGATFEVWLDPNWFLRAEGHTDWAVFPSDADEARGYLRFVGTLGVGLAL